MAWPSWEDGPGRYCIAEPSINVRVPRLLHARIAKRVAEARKRGESETIGKWVRRALELALGDED